MKKMTHFDESGNAIMVDVSNKAPTKRTAVASGIIQVSQEVMDALVLQSVKKGDVLNVARIAGIMATKKTSDLIPMCHLINITKSQIDYKVDTDHLTIKAICTVSTTGPTGVEMEALTGVNVALLTIYDMCKAIDHTMVMSDIHLVKKTGGKSGEFTWME